MRRMLSWVASWTVRTTPFHLRAALKPSLIKSIVQNHAIMLASLLAKPGSYVGFKRHDRPRAVHSLRSSLLLAAALLLLLLLAGCGEQQGPTAQAYSWEAGAPTSSALQPPLLPPGHAPAPHASTPHTVGPAVTALPGGSTQTPGPATATGQGSSLAAQASSLTVPTAGTAVPTVPAVPAHERSRYLHLIQQDLAYWAPHGGISQALVEDAERRVRGCDAGWLRFQIVGGRLYASHDGPGPAGFYPAELGRGWVSGKGRVPLAILALLDVLHAFPEEVPDVDAVLYTGDIPCIPKSISPSPTAAAAGSGSAAGAWVAPPAFGFNGHANYTDLPFPDFSYYGHEVNMLDDDKGAWLYGWDNQLAFLNRTWQQPLEQRQAQVVWRGRYQDERDELRRRFVECSTHFWDANDSGSAQLFNLWNEQGAVGLSSMCRFRYQAYLESRAWSTNLKQKLACGAVVMAPPIQYYEFWSRELVPGRHYVAVDSGETLCQDVAAKVKAMNAFLDAGSDSMAAGPARGGHATAKEMQQLQEQAPSQTPQRQQRQQQQQQERQQASLAAGGSSGPKRRRQRQLYAWGSSLTPQEIAEEGRQFLLERVRLQDARLYLRDMLQEYAALQTFLPRPTPGALCYTGPRLLEALGTPHLEDAADVAGQYPWLSAWDPGCS